MVSMTVEIIADLFLRFNEGAKMCRSPDVTYCTLGRVEK